MKEYCARKKADALAKQSSQCESVATSGTPTIEETTLAIEKAAIDTPSVEEMDNDIMGGREPYKYEDDNEEDIPVNVTYLTVSRNFWLSLANSRRGKTLVDGTKVRDYIIKFRDGRYVSKSLDERKGIETSPAFLKKEIEIFSKGVKPLYPEVKRSKTVLPPLAKIEQSLGINGADVSPEVAAKVFDDWEGNNSGGKPPTINDI